MQLFQQETPALSTLGKDADGEMMGVTVLNVQVTLLLEYLNVSWSPSQINEACVIAYNEFYWLSLAELKQFFLRMKMGVYESHKNLNPAILMGFLSEYCEETKAERYAYYSVEAVKTKWTPPENPVSDEVFASVLAETINFLTPPSEPTIAERLGGEDKFEEAKAKLAEKLKESGIPESIINQYWNK